MRKIQVEVIIILCYFPRHSSAVSRTTDFSEKLQKENAIAFEHGELKTHKQALQKQLQNGVRQFS